MKVAILYSGGKDSTYAIDYAMQKKWEIKYLLSVKPTRTDCYLFHFATVEHTKEIAKILNIPHILTSCDVADPKKEADIVKNIILKNPVDAVILGGTGLQETQLKSLQDALLPNKIEVFAAHAGFDHSELMKEIIDKNYEIMITQVASEGLLKWLGKIITKENFSKLKEDSIKYGFHFGFEGGYADTLVLDAPIFKKKLQISSFKKVIEDDYCGYIEVEGLKIVDKISKHI